jgi:hypothetical protein
VHERHVDHAGLVHDQQVALQRALLRALEAAVRRVGLEQAVDRAGAQARALASRLAARPVGAARATSTPLATSTFRIEFTSVVLPTPGPPVTTSTFERSASPSASRWLGARPSPVLPSTQGTALSASIPGQGGGPSARRRSRSAMPRSARCRPARNTQARPSTSSDHVAARQLERERLVHHLGRDLQQLGGRGPQLVRGQAAVALVHRLGEREGDPRPGTDHRVLLDPEPRRDGSAV